MTNADVTENLVSSCAILNADGEDVTAYFTNITTVKGTLTVNPAPVTVTTGSASKPYDGTALTCAEASITGLVNGETVTVTATGTITDEGTADNTYEIEWGTTSASNYTITENLGRLEILPPEGPVIEGGTEGEITVTSPAASSEGAPDDTLMADEAANRKIVSSGEKTVEEDEPKEELKADEKCAAKEEADVKEEQPADEKPAAKEEAEVKEEQPADEKPAAKEEAEVKEEQPAEEKLSAKEETKAKEDQPAEEKPAAEKESEAKEDQPAEEKPAAKEETKAKEDQPKEEKPSAKEETKAKEDQPADKKPSAGNETRPKQEPVTETIISEEGEEDPSAQQSEVPESAEG